MIVDMQHPALLVFTALRVMHPELYWASVRTYIELGCWSTDQGLQDMHHLLKHWASVYTGTSIMYNQQLPNHWNPKCPPRGIQHIDLHWQLLSCSHAVE